MLVFTHPGEAGISGILKAMTSAKGISTTLLNIPQNATHYFHYNSGATANLLVGETITQETSGATAVIVGIAADNGAIGTSDAEGTLFINQITGTTSAAVKTWTGGRSTGTVSAIAAPLPLRVYGQPKSILFSVETASINFTLDGTPPTATAGTNLGHTISSGSWLSIEGWMNVRGFQAINAVASSGAILKYTLFY